MMSTTTFFKRHINTIFTPVLLLLLLLGVQNVHAQCDCALVGSDNFSLSSGDGVGLDPYCSPPVIVTGTVSNLNEKCSITARVTIEFVVPTFSTFTSVIEDNTNDLVYVGSIPLVNESFAMTFNGLGQPLHLRRLSFDFLLAPNQDLTFNLPFEAQAAGLFTCTTTGPMFPWTINTYHTSVDGNGNTCSSLPLPGYQSANGVGLFFWNRFYQVITGTKKLSELPITSIGNNWLENIIIAPEPGSNQPGELIVDENATAGSLTDPTPKEIRLTAGSSIRVTNNSTLTLRSPAFLISACTKLAKGIIVEAGSTLIGTDFSFNDCRTAIDAHPNSTLSALNCTFNDNYIGINMNMTAPPFKVNINKIENNIFRSVKQLKLPYPGMSEQVESRGYCGIYAKNYTGLDLFDKNLFTSLSNGIIAEKTIGILDNQDFIDIKSTGTVNAYPRQGYGIHLYDPSNISYANINVPWKNSSFIDCKTGIFMEGYAGKIENVNILNCESGIEWVNSRNRDIRIIKNRIKAIKSGITTLMCEPTSPISRIELNNVETSGSQASGISVIEEQMINTVGGWDVLNNEIILKKGGAGVNYWNGAMGQIAGNSITNHDPTTTYVGIDALNHSWTGIRGNNITQSGFGAAGKSWAIRSASGFFNLMTCNCVDNTETGIQMYDMANITLVRGNHMNHHVTGLKLGDDGMEEAYIGDQIHAGNTWDLAYYTGTNGDFGGIHYGNTPQIIAQSQFIVDESEQAEFNPPVDPSENWFIDQSNSAQSYYCLQDCNTRYTGEEAPVEPNTPTKLDAAIVTGQLPTLHHDAPMKWKGDYRLFRRLLRQPNLAALPPYQSFFVRENTRTSGRLAFIAEERSRLYEQNTAQIEYLETIRAAFAEEYKIYFELDSMKQKGLAIDEARYLMAFSRIQSLSLQLQDIRETENITRSQRVQNLLLANSQVVADNTSAANQKEVNHIVLNTLENGELSTQDISALKSIADQCPLEGGDAVYEARSILYKYWGIQYDDYASCATPKQRTAVTNQEITTLRDVKIFPNPSNGVLQWSSSQNSGSQIVEVYDAMGTLRLKTTTDEHYINLNALPDGNYAIRITGNSDSVLYKFTLVR